MTPMTEATKTARILDGRAAAGAIKAELTERVAALKAQGITPGIATALKAGTGTDVEALQARVDKLAADFPLYPQHEQW